MSTVMVTDISRPTDQAYTSESWRSHWTIYPSQEIGVKVCFEAVLYINIWFFRTSMYILKFNYFSYVINNIKKTILLFLLTIYSLSTENKKLFASNFHVLILKDVVLIRIHPSIPWRIQRLICSPPVHEGVLV